MKRVMKRTMVLVLLVLLVTTSLALAQSRQGRMPPGPPDPALGTVAHALRALDLTNDQRDQIRDIVQGYMEGDLGALAQNHGESTRTLETAIWTTTASEQEIAEAYQAMVENGELLAQTRHLLALEILNVLTEEQQVALQQMIQEGPRGPGGPGGQRGPGGGGGRGGRGGYGEQDDTGR